MTRFTAKQKDVLADICQRFICDDFGMYLMGPWVVSQGGRWGVKTDQQFGFWRLWGDGDDEKIDKGRMDRVINGLCDIQDVLDRHEEPDDIHADHTHTYATRSDRRVVRLATAQIEAVESLFPSACMSIGQTSLSCPAALWSIGGDVVAIVMACFNLTADTDPGWRS